MTGEFIPGFCLTPGCPEPALEGSHWCEFHQPADLAAITRACDDAGTLDAWRGVNARVPRVVREVTECFLRLFPGLGTIDPSPLYDGDVARQLHCAAPAQVVRRPLETAPGDRRLSELGYHLVRIVKDPETGRDLLWLWLPGPRDDGGEC